MENKNAPQIQLIAGLGNPGPDYAKTRHNAGAWFLERLCEQYNIVLKTDIKFNARIGVCHLNGKEFKVLIPNTYMNHSGQSVGAIKKYFNIPVNAILVAHDELDIPVGTIRFKTDGGHGGHNGLRDIIHHLSAKDFHRLRIGIGHPGDKNHVLNFVLNRASKIEEQKINQAIDEALQMLPKIINGDYQSVMNQLHSFTA